VSVENPSFPRLRRSGLRAIVGRARDRNHADFGRRLSSCANMPSAFGSFGDRPLSPHALKYRPSLRTTVMFTVLFIGLDGVKANLATSLHGTRRSRT
jgi:hypothetical protein